MTAEESAKTATKELHVERETDSKSVYTIYKAEDIQGLDGITHQKEGEYDTGEIIGNIHFYTEGGYLKHEINFRDRDTLWTTLANMHMWLKSIVSRDFKITLKDQGIVKSKPKHQEKQFPIRAHVDDTGPNPIAYLASSIPYWLAEIAFKVYSEGAENFPCASTSLEEVEDDHGGWTRIELLSLLGHNKDIIPLPKPEDEEPEEAQWRKIGKGTGCTLVVQRPHASCLLPR